jgi:hypothetical protein
LWRPRSSRQLSSARAGSSRMRRLPLGIIYLSSYGCLLV